MRPAMKNNSFFTNKRTETDTHDSLGFQSKQAQSFILGKKKNPGQIIHLQILSAPLTKPKHPTGPSLPRAQRPRTVIWPSVHLKSNNNCLRDRAHNINEIAQNILWSIHVHAELSVQTVTSGKYSCCRHYKISLFVGQMWKDVVFPKEQFHLTL